MSIEVIHNFQKVINKNKSYSQNYQHINIVINIKLLITFIFDIIVDNDVSNLLITMCISQKCV
jgi:hypothetical protein